MRSWIRKNLVRAGALAVLFGVLLPNVSYVGHWGSSAHVHPIQREAEAAAHASHCHLGPSQCSGQSDFTGTWWFGQAPFSIVVDAPTRMIHSSIGPAEPDPPASRILEPPRAA